MTKIISLLGSDHDLARAIKQGDNKALNTFYDKYAGKMLAICKRYLSDGMIAEDVMITGLTKVIAKIDQFGFNGSFEGWVKRIIVNEALMKIRSQKNNEIDIDTVAYTLPIENEGDHLEADDLFNMVASLPDGYRTVFNLYAIEGFGHKEIAEKLGISEGTSKSQLSRARAMLQNMLQKIEHSDLKQINRK
jgi:RNA polymerase sigma-70 factor (ECF subfamily)